MKIIGNELIVGFHEWASSLRTSGMPIYAILNNGEVKEIGRTEKRVMKYKLPQGIIAIVRRYASFKGYLTYYVYNLNGEVISIIDEKRNYFEEVGKLQSPLKEAIISLLKSDGLM
jgi:hypothetical protein